MHPELLLIPEGYRLVDSSLRLGGKLRDVPGYNTKLAFIHALIKLKFLRANKLRISIGEHNY